MPDLANKAAAERARQERIRAVQARLNALSPVERDKVTAAADAAHKAARAAGDRTALVAHREAALDAHAPDHTANATALQALLLAREAQCKTELDTLRAQRDDAARGMLASGRSKADVARALGISRAAVTQRFATIPASAAS